MSQFIKENVDLFLGAVRKYMQVRGPMSQKELAELTQTGVSTMSRFLNQQTKELNPQLIAQIVAKLNIPLHEIIDFVEESYTEQFVRLVKFYKGEEMTSSSVQTQSTPVSAPPVQEEEEDVMADALGGNDGGSQVNAQAKIRVGNKMSNLTFKNDNPSTPDDLKELLKRLSLKQKGFLNEFLKLDSDGRDLVADVGRNIISYLRQKGIDF